MFFNGLNIKELGLNILLTGWVVLIPLRLLAKETEKVDDACELHPACQTYWEALGEEKQASLKQELKGLTPFDSQALDKGSAPHFLPFSGQVNRFDQTFLSAHPRAMEGKVALVTLAGGQATRLKSSIPKGCIEVSPIFHRSLFEAQAGYLKALKEEAGDISWAIMTSQATDRATRDYFEAHAYFGLDAADVDFFLQADLPLVDDSGRYVIDEEGKILAGPDGNGAVLHHLVQAPLWGKWKQRGVEVVVIVPVDNPLAYPFDQAFLNPVFEALDASTLEDQVNLSSLTIASVAVRRRQPQEKVGVFASCVGSSGYPGRYGVAEYSEIDPLEAQAMNDEGNLVYSLANCGLFALPLIGIEYLVDQPLEKMPWHLARKEYVIASKGVDLVKRERFIFDFLALWPGELELVVYPREWIFAPIKAPQDLEASGKAWILRDQMQLKGILGEPLEIKDFFELNTFAWSPKNFEAIRGNWTLAVLGEDSDE